jgi:hypothetical protein
LQFTIAFIRRCGMLAPAMVDKQPTEPDHPTPLRNAGDRQRRGRRGGRGRGRRRTEQITRAGPPPPAAAAPAPGPAAAPSAISQAIEEVTQIVESLKQTLDQMEEVLELVELAERQKLADEREIESLSQALRKIHQPQGGQREPLKHNG